MPIQVRRPEALAWQVFRGTDAVREGLVTPNGLRGGSWQRLRQDVYADSRLDRDHALACLAAALTLPEDAVIAGRSAAYRHGVDSYGRSNGRTFEESEPELQRSWEKAKGDSSLSWDEAKDATRDSWQRVSDSIERAVPGDSDRDGR